mmetsp:Transcript_25256/g.46946  ORF Transcript_25256/g.46946 Transcript_25256/m.46946 type:complete len:86 (+) Transcript_25256:1666-1923(+)
MVEENNVGDPVELFGFGALSAVGIAARPIRNTAWKPLVTQLKQEDIKRESKLAMAISLAGGSSVVFGSVGRAKISHGSYAKAHEH